MPYNFNRIIIGFICISLTGCFPSYSFDSPKVLTNAYISGVCSNGLNDEQLQLSVVLADRGTETRKPGLLTPKSTLFRESLKLGEILQEQPLENIFSFNLPARSIQDAPSVRTNSYIQYENGTGFGTGVDLRPQQLRFEYTGGSPTDTRDHLVLLLLDQSGSLVGKIPNLPPDPNQATDFSNQRITFFKQFIQRLPSNYALSLITYNDRFTDYIPRNQIVMYPTSTSQPIFNRESIEERLQDLTSAMEREGGTPLKEAVKDAVSFVNEYKADYRISIILFTDGLGELGDTSPSQGVDLITKAGELAVSRVPVHVIDLQPPATVDPQYRGRSTDLSEFACITGGDYIFIRDANQFTTSKRLLPMLSNRIAGQWILTTDVAGLQIFPPDTGHLLSTDFKVTLGPISVTDSLTLSSSGEYQDNRLWFYKY